MGTVFTPPQASGPSLTPMPIGRAAHRGITAETVDAVRSHLSRADGGAEPKVLDVGFSSTVVRFGSSVVRIARTDQAAEGHVREAEIVRVLAGRLPVDVPGPCRLIPRRSGLPYGASVAPWLPGEPMTADAARQAPALVEQIASNARRPPRDARGIVPPWRAAAPRSDR